MKTQKGFKKAFTLVEMMIVVAIIAILAGMAIPMYTKYVLKSESTEAVRFLKQIVDAQAVYKSIHGKLYASPGDINKTLDVLNIDAPGGEFEYGMKVGDTTALLRANKVGDTNYIYMFFPENASSKITNYNADEWDSTVYTHNYVNLPATPIVVDLTGDGTPISTY